MTNKHPRLVLRSAWMVCLALGAAMGRAGGIAADIGAVAKPTRVGRG